MADFSFLSDLSDASESAIDDLLAQTRDLCLLEQLSDLNCASFSRADLSSDLESRFTRLKSLPAAPRAASPRHVTHSSESSQRRAASARHDQSSSVTSPRATSPPRTPPAASSEPDPPSSVSSPRSTRSRRAHRGPVRLPPTRPRSRVSSEKECSIALQTAGCLFWCSPKKKKKEKEEKKKKMREVDLDSDLGWSKSEELLEDLGSFSIEEQRKILRKAMEEQRKISREARKMVKMGKRASLKTSFSSPELSDD